MHKLGVMCEEDLIYSAMLLICTHTIFMPCDRCQGALLSVLAVRSACWTQSAFQAFKIFYTSGQVGAVIVFVITR